MASRRAMRIDFYDEDNQPIPDFNSHVTAWLSGGQKYKRPTPKAFDKLLALYRSIEESAEKVTKGSLSDRWNAHRFALTRLTDVMFGVDLGPELESRLTSDAINETGFRTTLAQGVAKNTGEAFINLMTYALAECLRFQDDVIVEKGMPRLLKPILTLDRRVEFSVGGAPVDLHLPIEVDLCIYSRTEPANAILVSAKTRLKEVFHIAVMWKLFFDVIGDRHCMEKWGFERNGDSDGADASKMLYTFATADMVRKTGRKSQGPDVERRSVRNLIAMDASFMDYVFVSKPDIPHVSPVLSLENGREALFHELGCILDLVLQKFDLNLEPDR